MKKLTVYNVYLDDGKDAFRVTIPAAVSVLIAPMKANDEIQQVCNRLFA